MSNLPIYCLNVYRVLLSYHGGAVCFVRFDLRSRIFLSSSGCYRQEIMELNTEMSSMNISMTSDVISIQHEIPTEKQVDVEYKEVDENCKSNPRRSLRKRIRPPDKPGTVGESTKIKKMNENVSDIEKYYLCKKIKRLPSTLETIFEEPKQQNNNMKQYVSTRKFKRTIQFEEDLAAAHKLKLRKRQLKAKKLASSKGFFNRKKVSMDTLLKKLSGVECDKE